MPGDPDEARPLDVVQGERHGGLGQAGDAGQLGPGAGPALADVLEQQLLVHRPDQRGTRREQDTARALRGGRAEAGSALGTMPRVPSDRAVTATSSTIVLEIYPWIAGSQLCPKRVSYTLLSRTDS